MSALYRLSGETSPPPEPDYSFQPPFASEYDQGPQYWAKTKKWFRKNVLGQTEPEIPSGYLTLIPLNDSRLKPRRTALLVGLLLLLALSAAACTFFLVPRGVSLGSITVSSTKMSWNMTHSTYTLNLKAVIPVYNPNYLGVQVSGKLSISFYDSEAGTKTLEPIKIAPRTSPELTEVDVDASNLPTEYILTILTQCSTFPSRLIFFLKGTFETKYMAQTTILSPTDTFFIINCSNGGQIDPHPHSLVNPPDSHHPPFKWPTKPLKEDQ